MSRFRSRAYPLLGLPLALSVFLPMLSGSGFDDASRSTFVVLAGIALLTVGLFDPAGVGRAARSPIASTLLALVALSAASAIWTIGNRSDALRWALVIVDTAPS